MYYIRLCLTTLALGMQMNLGAGSVQFGKNQKSMGLTPQDISLHQAQPRSIRKHPTLPINMESLPAELYLSILRTCAQTSPSTLAKAASLSRSLRAIYKANEINLLRLFFSTPPSRVQLENALVIASAEDLAEERRKLATQIVGESDYCCVPDEHGLDTIEKREEFMKDHSKRVIEQRGSDNELLAEAYKIHFAIMEIAEFAEKTFDENGKNWAYDVVHKYVYCSTFRFPFLEEEGDIRLVEGDTESNITRKLHTECLRLCLREVYLSAIDAAGESLYLKEMMREVWKKELEDSLRGFSDSPYYKKLKPKGYAEMERCMDFDEGDHQTLINEVLAETFLKLELVDVMHPDVLRSRSDSNTNNSEADNDGDGDDMDDDNDAVDEEDENTSTHTGDKKEEVDEDIRVDHEEGNSDNGIYIKLNGYTYSWKRALAFLRIRDDLARARALSAWLESEYLEDEFQEAISGPYRERIELWLQEADWWGAGDCSSDSEEEEETDEN